MCVCVLYGLSITYTFIACICSSMTIPTKPSLQDKYLKHGNNLLLINIKIVVPKAVLQHQIQVVYLKEQFHIIITSIILQSTYLLWVQFLFLEQYVQLLDSSRDVWLAYQATRYPCCAASICNINQ